jgi:PAS domain S-box-containing protein
LLPLSIAYALLRYRLLDVDLILSRSVSYGLLTLLIVGGYLLLVDLLGLLLGTSIGTDNPVWIAFFILLLTLAFEPLRTRLQRAADTLFFRDRIDYREELESYSHALGRLLSQSSVFAALASRVETALHPEQVVFYLYDTYEHQFAPLANTVQGRSKLICFSPDGGLASALLARGESLYLMADQPLPVDLEPEARQLTALGASLYVPMAQHGWMVLGEKRSGLPYTSSDLGYLEALGDQTGLALDKIQLISDLERRVSELNALYRTSQAVNSSLELQTVLNLITEKAVEISGAEGGSLFLIDPDSAELVLTFTVGPLGSEPLGLRVLPGQGIAGAVAHTRQPIIIDDVRQDPRWFPDLDQRTGYVTRTLLAVPLGSEDHSIGVLEVVNKKAGSSFDEQDQRLLLAFASHVTVAIENARLYQDVRRMKEFNEGLVQSMAEGMIVADATGHITLVNPAAAILLGYTTEELVGQRWMAFIPPDQHPIADAADERRARGEVDSYELELLHKDGRRVAVLVSGSPRFEQGRYQGSLAIFTDITQVLAHQKVERDLALAWEIQNGFLPDALPDVPGWQLAATLKPASETSGDFFDVISLPNGRVGLLVADVSDKGTAAALYMAVSCTLIRTFAVEYDKEPERALRAVHRRILADTKSDQFVTVFYGVLDPTTGTLTYCNAGHNSPYLFRAASYGGSAQQGALAEELDSTGPALGIRALNEMIWERRTVQLAPGDTLVLYSDGITEAQNLQRAFFDETRLLDVAQANVGRSAQTIQQAILAQVQEFVGDAPQMDDIALMVTVRCSPEGQTGL